MRFAITTELIRPDALHSEVRGDGDGAIVTFSGVVRNHSGDVATDHLVYEAYPEMAERKMAEIGEEVKQRWPIGDMAVVHRVGRVEVGEISVVIAVASPHRAEAFEACSYAIDRLKESVPIWKKEVGPDGHYWTEVPVAAAVVD